MHEFFNAYQRFEDEDNFAALVRCEDVLERNNGNMAISLYVRPQAFDSENATTFQEAYSQWETASQHLKSSMNALFEVLDHASYETTRIEFTKDLIS